jgi:hypothetical protein
MDATYMNELYAAEAYNNGQLSSQGTDFVTVVAT